MATAPQPRPGILEIEPYVPGESRLPAGKKPIKLSSNETPLGPSPKAIEAYKSAASSLERYPDGAARRCAQRSQPLWAQRRPHRLRCRLR